MTEKARKIFDILGVEPVEEFRIVRDGMLCRFSEDLTLQCKIGERLWDAVENTDTYRKIISGETKIIKIPKPTKEDEIVIAYAKLCGCKYIAKDENGKCKAFETRPEKIDTRWWKSLPNAKIIELGYNLSFLSWEDEKPYYIGE